jgi:hypothetical protein
MSPMIRECFNYFGRKRRFLGVLPASYGWPGTEISRGASRVGTARTCPPRETGMGLRSYPGRRMPTIHVRRDQCVPFRVTRWIGDEGVLIGLMDSTIVHVVSCVKLIQASGLSDVTLQRVLV